MKYLLDTNTCIYVMNQKPTVVRRAFGNVKVGDVGISTITLSELWYGVEHSKQREKNRDALRLFTAPLVIASYDDRAAEEYGVIRADLRKRGSMIGAMDLLIAAHAKALGVTLVTNNAREFKRIPGLRMENWVS